MENILATKLYSMVVEHLNLIPGVLSLHLKRLLAQLVLHGIHTDLPLEALHQEFATFNSRLMLASGPHSLKTLDERKDGRGSSLVIMVTGPRAEKVVSRRHPLHLLLLTPNRTHTAL